MVRNWKSPIGHQLPSRMKDSCFVYPCSLRRLGRVVCWKCAAFRLPPESDGVGLTDGRSHIFPPID
jgi:hypothetical protein